MPPSLRCPLGIETFEDRFLPSTSYLLTSFAPVAPDPSSQAGQYVRSAAPVDEGHATPSSASPISFGLTQLVPGERPVSLDRSSYPAGFGAAFDPGTLGSRLNDTSLAFVPPLPDPGEVPPPRGVAYPDSTFADSSGFDFTMFDSAARASAFARMSLPTATGQPIFLPANFAESVEARPAAGTDPLGRVVTPPISGATLVVGSRPGDVAVAPGLSLSSPEGDTLSPESVPPRLTESDNLPNPDVVLPQPPTPQVVATLAAITGWIGPTLPGGVLVAGVFGLDSAPLEHGAGQLLDHLADLAMDWPEGSEGSRVGTWLATAAALTIGAGYTVWATRAYRVSGRRQAVSGSVARWREVEDDSRTR